MSTALVSSGQLPEESFQHGALLYAGQDEFVDGTLPFIRDGLDAEEPILVVVGAAKIDLLRAALGRDADRAHFADMAQVGTNPARIIPAWQQFVTEHCADGRPVRGIGEPIWAGRTPAELIECQRHESLLNLAFAGRPAWSLLCPYDTNALDPAVIDEANRSHPIIMEGASSRESTSYRDLDVVARPFDVPLPDPPEQPAEIEFQVGTLPVVRKFVARQAVAAGLIPAKVDDLVLAVNELATNSLRHGGGGGTLRVWPDGEVLICEVRDGGSINQPLVGRERPSSSQDGGRGLWLVNQVCELVQIRSFANGSVVRLHMRRGK